MPKLLDMDITALRSTSHVMCCIKIFGYSESRSDSEEGSKSSSESEEDEDESKSESEASTKTGTYFVSKWCCVLSFVVLSTVVYVKQHPADMYIVCFTYLLFIIT